MNALLYYFTLKNSFKNYFHIIFASYVMHNSNKIIIFARY